VTLLVAAVTPDEITVLTDTLTTDVRYDTPNGHVTKCIVAPHLAAAAVTLGAHRLRKPIGDLMFGAVDVADCEDLAARLPGALRAEWKQIRKRQGRRMPPYSKTSNAEASDVWLFGADRQLRFRCWRFEAPGFAAARWPIERFAAPVVLGSTYSMGKSVADMVKLSVTLKAEQDSLPAEQRVPIGREVWATVMTDGQITQERVYVFS
jgi:hypothetical protein